MLDEVHPPCNNDPYTCGASLMPDGHLLATLVYCNETLTCATAIERMLLIAVLARSAHRLCTLRRVTQHLRDREAVQTAVS